MKIIAKALVCTLMGLWLAACGTPAPAMQQVEQPRALAAPVEAAPDSGQNTRQVRLLLPTGMEALEEILAGMATAEGIALQVETAAAGDNYAQHAAEAMLSAAPPDLLWLADEAQARTVAQSASFFDLLGGRNSPTAMRALANMVPEGQRLLDSKKVLGLPLGIYAEGYLVNLELLAALLDSQNPAELLVDLQLCSWQQWQTLVETIEAYLLKPQKITVTIGYHSYTMPRSRPAVAQPLRGIFAVADGTAEAWLGTLMDAAVANAFDSNDQLLKADDTERARQLRPALAALLGALDLETSHMARTSGSTARGERYVLNEPLKRADAQALFAAGTALFLPGSSQLAAELMQNTPEPAGNLALVPIKMPPAPQYETGDDGQQGLYTGGEDAAPEETDDTESATPDAEQLERVIAGNQRLLWKSGGSLCVNGASTGNAAAVQLLLRLFTSEAGQAAIADDLKLQCFSSPVSAGRMQSQVAGTVSAGQGQPAVWPVRLADAQKSLDAYMEQSELMAKPRWEQSDADAFMEAGIAAMGAVRYDAEPDEEEAP